MKYIKIKLGGGFNRNSNKLILLFAPNCILLGEELPSSPSRAASCKSSVTVVENRNRLLCLFSFAPALHTLMMDSLNNHIIYFHKRSDEHLQNAIFLLINMLEKTTENIVKELVTKTIPLPQDIHFSIQTFLFCLVLCGFECLLGIFQKKLSYLKRERKKEQPNRKGYSKILSTKQVMAGGESKAEHNRGYLHRQ